MKSISSVVLALDGESKAGKTAIVEHIETEALWQKGWIPDVLSPDSQWATILDEETKAGLADMHDRYVFNRVIRVIAGNVFRAAALHVIELELCGQTKTLFDDTDAALIQEIRAREGIEDVLQNNVAVGQRVTPVAKMVGVQALCKTIICSEIAEAYHTDGGANLVLVDARDPVGHMRRNGLIGTRPGQIHPASILPVYVDTSIEVAASRMPGSLDANIDYVRGRRHTDATREELPVVRPPKFHEGLRDWALEIYEQIANGQVAQPFRLDNGAGVNLDNIQYIAGVLAATASDQSIHLGNALHRV